MSGPEVFEGEATELPETSQELSVRPSGGLVRATSPAEFLERSSEIASALVQVVESKQLFTQIGPKKHVHVEGWTFLGSMMGAFGSAVYAVEDWTREFRDEEGKVIGWEARVIAKTIEGAEVGAAESMCTRRETKWQSKPDYALRSMAQTRASAKALRMPLGFLMQLAGYSATPKEEMDEPRNTPAAAAPVRKKVTKAFVAKLRKALEGVADEKPFWAVDNVLQEASRRWGRPIVTLEDLWRDEAEAIAGGLKADTGTEV